MMRGYGPKIFTMSDKLKEKYMRCVYLFLIPVVTCALIACGGGSSGGTPTPITPPTPPAVLSKSVFAGIIDGPGSTDGIGAAAKFYRPSSVATDSAGNIYVADSANHTIRKISPTGVVTTLAGSPGIVGSANGTGAAASFNSLTGIAADNAGNVYVTEMGIHAIRKITAEGAVTTFAGTPGVEGSVDGISATASFRFPSDVATDGVGNVYVADTANSTIRKILPTGVVTTMAGTAGSEGSADGIGAAARFSMPAGLAVDKAGNVYVADTENHTIRKITLSGVVTTLAGAPGISGHADGIGAVARFVSPRGIGVDSAGLVYVADDVTSTVRRITPDGGVTTLAGTPGVEGRVDGGGAAASFFRPADVATDSAGNIYVADLGNDSVRKITPTGLVTTLAGAVTAAAHFVNLAGIVVDSTGNVYTADYGNTTLSKLTPAGVMTALAGGLYTIGVGKDGFGSVASFSALNGAAVDSAGNIYVTESSTRFVGHQVEKDINVIRKITPDRVVTTLAGNPDIVGSADGTGAAASFGSLGGIATDSAANVYVADSGNGTIRKISPTGFVTTLAGTARLEGSADGIGSAARFGSLGGVATDSAGNVYVADYGNNTIRKISPTGVVTTLAGTAGSTGNADGIGAAARFSRPTNIAIDSRGNLYVADVGNNSIRKITPSGTVTTILSAVANTAEGQVTGLAVSGSTLYISVRYGIYVVRNLP